MPAASSAAVTRASFLTQRNTSCSLYGGGWRVDVCQWLRHADEIPFAGRRGDRGRGLRLVEARLQLAHLPLKPQGIDPCTDRDDNRRRERQPDQRGRRFPIVKSVQVGAGAGLKTLPYTGRLQTRGDVENAIAKLPARRHLRNRRRQHADDGTKRRNLRGALPAPRDVGFELLPLVRVEAAEHVAGGVRLQ